MKKLLKKIIPLNTRLMLREIPWYLHIKAIKIFSLSGITSSLYYFLFSRKFDREHLSVLRGKLSYQQAQSSSASSSAKLRRNIHRLEKGLIMRPRRTIFAEDYITDTVDTYIKLSTHETFCLDEKKWANDVLEEYFSVVGQTKIIDLAKQNFFKNSDNIIQSDGSLSFKPYEQGLLPQPAIKFTQLVQLIERRRSVRWYLDKPVDFSHIKQAIDLASTAPSACNRQPYRFIVADNKEKASKIANLAGGTKGFAENFPALVVVVGDLSAYPYERDRHLIYIDSSLATMQLMLALETEGLSSCSINWPDVESAEKQIQSLLSIKDYERVIMLLAIGYADSKGGVPFSQKKKSRLLIQRI